MTVEQTTPTNRAKKQRNRKELSECANGNILEPNDLPMILKAYATLAGKIAEGVLKLVCGTVGILSRNLPVLEIHGEALAAVNVTGDARPVAYEEKGVPFAHGLGKIVGGSYAVVERPV